MPMSARLAMVALGTVMLVGGCTQNPEDPGALTPINASNVPPVPTNVRLQVLPSQVVVSWEVADTTGVTMYRVYRAVGTGEFSFLGGTTNLAYTDHSVAAGNTYRYQVASLKGGLEGVHSVTVSATPNMFAIVLDGGVAATAANSVSPGSRKIVVGLVAPATTVAFRLSEDPTLAGAAVQSYNPGNPVGLFALSAGDGPKTVYAQFTDVDGSISETVSASIILDTKAVIESVTEDSSGQVLGANDILHVTVTVDSTGGVVHADLPGAFQGLELFDDGTNGDAMAFDGTYERDFWITPGLETRASVVTASFLDEVGNEANERSSATRVTIADPPDSVSWQNFLIRVTGASIELHWTMNHNADFGEYRIFRSLRALPGDPIPAVTDTSALVAAIPGQSTVSIVDDGPPGGFPGGGKYSWGIVVIDENGFESPMAKTTYTLGYDPVLSAFSLTPANGPSTTTFQWNATYSHGQASPPEYVNVVVDGTLIFPMTRVSGSPPNWVGGEAFQVSVTGLTNGSHRHYYEARDSNGVSVRYPEDPTASLAGPLVTP
jgi:hypothetical protein